eukprot:SAG31_NODE_1657_length_7619_cov_10.364362_4_plen_173_part_00
MRAPTSAVMKSDENYTTIHEPNVQLADVLVSGELEAVLAFPLLYEPQFIAIFCIRYHATLMDPHSTAFDDKHPVSSRQLWLVGHVDIQYFHDSDGTTSAMMLFVGLDAEASADTTAFCLLVSILPLFAKSSCAQAFFINLATIWCTQVGAAAFHVHEMNTARAPGWSVRPSA